MTTLEFLQFILPLGGCYAKMVLEPGGAPKQVLYDTVEELFAGITHSRLQANKNIYFAVASFNNKSSRKQTNVHAVKSLFIDIDCGPGKPYITKREGMQALAKFVSATSMPMPTIVDSGNGIHVYWVFTEEIPAADWTQLATAFKNSIQQHKFQVDMSVPADSARVLRPIGTTNLKGGGTVKLLKQGEPTDPAFFFKKFIGTPASPVVPSVPASIDGLSIPAHIQNRSAKIVTLYQAADYPPAHPGVVADKCLQIKWGIENQDKVTEPFWYAMLGVAAHCLDSEETAKEWSNKHPGYSDVATLAKMARWKASTTGPATCAKFASEREKGCDKCKFSGKVATPAQIGVSADAVPLSADAPDKVALEIPIPQYFKRVNKNGVVALVKVLENTDIDVCKFDVYPMSYGRDETLGYEVVRFRWKRPHVGWSDLVLRQALLNQGSARDFATALADQGIVLASTRLVELFQEMLRAYMDELRNLRSLTNLYQNMGWKERNTQFLWGTTMLTRMVDGEIVETDMAMSGNMQSSAQDMYHEKGTLQAAVAATAVLEQQKMFVHMFCLGVALSAPLYKFTGIDGLIVHLYGDTGAGKSLAQNWMQSMWGDPKLLHYTSQFTINALYARLGFHCNLPMTIDETTQMKPEDAANLTLMISQGRSKYRLDKNAEEKAPKTWAGPTCTSGNHPLSSTVRSFGAEHEAQLMRILDVPIKRHRIFDVGTRAGELIYRAISADYGHIGPALLRHIMKMGEAAIVARIDAHKILFEKKYGVVFKGPERFWQAGLVLADLAMEMARELGLLLFDHEKAMIHVLQEMDLLRKNVVEARVDDFDLLADYMNEHVRETLTMMHTGTDKPVWDINREPRGSLYIRLDLYRTTLQHPLNRGTMVIDKKHLRDWLATHGGNIKTMTSTFADAGILVQIPNNKAVLSKGVRGLSVPQLVVIGINLDHPRLKGILDDADDAMLNTQMAKLTLVKP